MRLHPRRVRLLGCFAMLWVLCGLTDAQTGQAAVGAVQQRARQTATAKREATRKPAAERLRGLRFEFVAIEPGEFLMGSNSGDDDEKPVHRVRLSKPFEMGKYEVTQAQWEAVMGTNPSQFKGADRPVERVSWYSAQAFISKLNGLGDGYCYRLPTEAEWEYAARAGSTAEPPNLDAVAWCGENYGGQTHPVGQKQANAWGLRDMLGNVWEWCADWYDPHHYRSSPSEDPSGPASGSHRVLRGGSWLSRARGVRWTVRDLGVPDGRVPDLGLRVVRERSLP